MYKYFKSKLYLRSDKLDPLILENILKPKLPVNLLSKIISLTKTCDANRFSPGSNKKAKDLILDGTDIYIKKIYDNLGKAYKITRNGDLDSSIYLFDVMSTYQIQSKKNEKISIR